MRKSLIEALRETSELSIRDVNYLWGVKSEVYSKLYPRRGTPREIARFLYRWARSMRLLFSVGPRVSVPERPILFFADSINQFRAMDPVKQRIAEGAFWVERGLSGGLAFPAWFARSASVLFLPIFAFRAFRDPVIRRTLAYGLADYLDSYGFYLAGLIWLPRIQPRALVLSNDHSAQTRALLFAARALDIPTIYLQHASVTEDFPPLEFDYALLDGMDAFRKYRVGRDGCRIYLVGNSRRLAPSRNAPRTGIPAVGLAFSDLDPSPLVERIIAEARTELSDCTVFIRPHPGDQQRFEWFKRLAEKSGAAYSDPRSQNVWDFLAPLDFLVAGHSNIFLDAAQLAVIPLQHEALAGGYDHYGFMRSRLLQKIGTFSEIRDLLARLPSLRKDLAASVREYDVTFDTELQGRAAELAASVVRDKVLGTGSPFVEERLEVGATSCYRLRPGAPC